MHKCAHYGNQKLPNSHSSISFVIFSVECCPAIWGAHWEVTGLEILLRQNALNVPVFEETGIAILVMRR